MTRLPVAVIAAVVLAMGGATPAAAQPDRVNRPGSPVYLVLGDSVAAGAGAQPYVTGYPEQVGGLLLERGYNTAADKATPNAAVDFDVINYAVGGATTATLIAAQLPKAVQLIEERIGDRDPFNDVEVITVTIGGNDIFNPAVTACILTTSPASCQPAVDAALTAIHAGLMEILEQLTSVAGRDTEVVITTYYNPIGSCYLSQANPAAVAIADVVLEGGTVPGLLSVEEGLNDLIRRAAATTGAQVADLYGALGPGQYVGGRDCTHPNLTGHTTIADIVYETIAR
jgi:lysophospholipase L1-like esterase